MSRSTRWRIRTLMSAGLALLFAQTAIAAAPEMIFTNLTTDAIQRADLDGSGLANLRLGANSLGVAVDLVGAKIYWTELGVDTVVGDETIRRSNLDGSGVEVLLDNLDGLTHPTDIELDVAAGKMYWSDIGAPAGRISRANLDGSAVETLFNVLDHRGPNFGNGPGQTLEFGSVWGIALDLVAGNLYWTDFFGADIHRSALDGSGVSGPLVSGFVTLRGLTVDAASGLMYWTDSFDSTIYRAALDGTNVQLIADDVVGVDTPFDVEIDAIPGKLYWTNNGAGTVQRSDLDGQNVETLVVLPGQDLIGLALAGTPPPVPSMGGYGLAMLTILLAFMGGALPRKRIRTLAWSSGSR